jgi:hypothetical protein
MTFKLGLVIYNAILDYNKKNDCTHGVLDENKNKSGTRRKRFRFYESWEDATLKCLFNRIHNWDSALNKLL